MYSRLKDLREDLDLSQKEMGIILNMSQPGYSKYETGENDIPTSILIELADYHHTSVDYLLNLTDVKQPYPRAKKIVY
ncbi:helix-turn-helix transcriptional regulator [Lachnospiraceae bacterium JLR.KK008]